MKGLLKIAAALATIAGIACLVFAIVKKQADKSVQAQENDRIDDEYAPLPAQESESGEEIKQTVQENIAARHTEAAVEMKESAETILETSVPVDQTNAAKLEEIKDTLKDIG